MAYQGIGTGTTPNDNTGDSLLIGAVKVNSNFQEIYNALGDGSNINFNQNTEIIAGNGLTGGGDLSANRTLNVGSGTGIDVAADSISINSSYRFPSGTRMLFQQTSAPTGWTKDTTTSVDNRALRVVSGTAGSGGSTAFTSVFASNRSVPLPQHSHGITEPNNGQGHNHGITEPNNGQGHNHGYTEPNNGQGHNHGYTTARFDDGPSGSGFFSISGDSSPNSSGIINTATTGISINRSTTGISINRITTGISINNEGTAGASMNFAVPMNFAVQYIDVIIAQRD
jgi:hypothetical protein